MYGILGISFEPKCAGGSLRDYLGYGVTLGTWYMEGREPIEVTCVVDEVPGIEVDQHSITVCRYQNGLSKHETRWGTISDPWVQQPLPKCGFVLVGESGAISSYDYEPFVTIQTRADPAPRAVPADALPAGRRTAVETMLACIRDGAPLTGPLDPAVSLVGQRIIDSAVLSSETKQTVALVA